MRYLFIALIFLTTSAISQNIPDISRTKKLGQFQKLIQLRDQTILNSDIRYSLFNQHDNFQFDNVRFDGIHVRNDSYIVIRTMHFDNNEPSKNYSIFLSSFSYNAEVLDVIRVNGGKSDCSFSNQSSMNIIDSLTFNISTVKQDFDCTDGSLLSQITSIDEYKISPYGIFERIGFRDKIPDITYELKKLSISILPKTYFEGKSIEDLALMRNYIFASYGYKFKSKYWSDYFSDFEWYEGNTEDINIGQMLLVEQINLSNIIEAEKK